MRWMSRVVRSAGVAAGLAGVPCGAALAAAPARGVADAAPNAQTLKLADCGHAPHRERPDEVLEAIVGFVSQLPST